MYSVGDKIIYDKNTIKNMIKTFMGREDIYSKETLNNVGRRVYAMQYLPISDAELERHLAGDCTIGSYIQRQNGTVKHIVFDVDVSKKIILKYKGDSDEFKEYMRKSYGISLEISKLLTHYGIKGYIEDSGHRGYHVWMFLTEWIQVRYAILFCELIQREIDLDDDSITLECFPNKTRVRPDKPGQVIKLPYGIHHTTGRRSYFLDEGGNRIEDINVFIDGIATYSLGAIKKILAANTKEEVVETKEVDYDLSAFGALPVSVKEVLIKCNLMRYLCQKAAKTGYLVHFERLSVLNVFGHLGDEGKGFVHKVMSLTINYNYNVTEGFIRRLHEKPISCLKLRDNYKKLTAEFGCSCVFKKAKNCYPSPVLHAIALSSDVGEVTIPTSRSMTKENEKKVLGEINIHAKSQELASKILEMRKQKRGLDKNIAKLERELEEIFDSAVVDCLEIEMGLLVRRKLEQGYEWLVEI